MEVAGVLNNEEEMGGGNWKAVEERVVRGLNKARRTSLSQKESFCV